LYSFPFYIDTASQTYHIYNNSIVKIGSFNYSASYFKGTLSNKYQSILIKFNETYSDTLYTKTYNSLGVDGSMLWVINKKNDTLLVIGSYNYQNNNSYSTFFETDTAGVIRWQKDFDCAGDCNMKPFHILPTEDNGFIFTCFESHINGQPGVDDFQTAVIKTDSLGNTQWRHTWGGDTTKNVGSWVVPLDDGNFLFAWTDNLYLGWNGDYKSGSTIHFIKFDIYGNVIWHKDLSNYLVDRNYSISQMELMPDGNILVSGYNPVWGLMLKIDQDANYIWHRELMPPGLAYEDNSASMQNLKILGVTFTSDDGFILAGEYFSSPGNMFPEVYQSAFAYKLDEYGCYEPGCNVHDNIEVVELNEAVGFTLQPNPTKHFVQVKSSKLKVESVAIYEITGGLIKKISVKETTDSFTLDVSDLKSGIYLVKIGEQTEKLVIE